MKEVKIRSGVTTKDISREFARDALDIQRDHLAEAFVGHYKPGSLFPTPDETDDALEALGRHWRDQEQVNEMQAKLKQYLHHGWLRVMVRGTEMVGFATAKPESVNPVTIAKRALLRAKPVVKLSRIYMTSDLHDIEKAVGGKIEPPIVQLGQTVLKNVDVHDKVVSRAAEEDHFTPEVLGRLGLMRRPLGVTLDDRLLGDEIDPVHMAQYESRRLVDQV